MFFEPGFLGTKAAMYMDVVTLYFAVLPLLLAFSIRFAVKGNIVRHYQSQIVILAITLVMVVIFELGVRISGGFIEYVKESGVNYTFMLVFLVVHIFVALAAVGGWLYLVIASIRAYRSEGREAELFGKHKKIGKWIFAALTLTSFMGCAIYIFLFVL